MDSKLQKFAELWKVASESLTRQEFVEAFKALRNAIQKFEDKQGKKSEELKEFLLALANKLEKEVSLKLKGLDGEPGYSPVKGKDYFDGLPGKDADEEKILEELLSKIPTSEEIAGEITSSGEAIRDALELLQDEERLDVSAIKGLEERLGGIMKLAGRPIIGTVRAALDFLTPPEAVNSSTVIFSCPFKPKYIIVDGVTKFEDIHYTYDGTSITITDGAAPVQFIRIAFEQ